LCDYQQKEKGGWLGECE